MIGRQRFRPWGLAPWLNSKMGSHRWSVFGCLSYEERCLAAFEFLSTQNVVRHIRFLTVHDPPSDYSKVAATKLNERRNAFLALGGTDNDLEDHDLFERTEDLVHTVREFIAVAGPSVLLDVTSFPKRFFLPILRLLFSATTIENLVVAYSLPDNYSSDPLAEDPEPWRHIPLFAPGFPEPKVELVLVALGFETLGLPDLVEHDYHDVALKFIFPFPPGPPTFQRTWEFLRKLDTGEPRREPPIRVHGLDISDTFDHLVATTDGGKRPAVLAPYGPKPVSVAMGIYAMLANAPIYYTQPRLYNPNYSGGTRQIDGVAQSYTYCLRLGGKNFYAMPP